MRGTPWNVAASSPSARRLRTALRASRSPTRGKEFLRRISRASTIRSLQRRARAKERAWVFRSPTGVCANMAVRLKWSASPAPARASTLSSRSSEKWRMPDKLPLINEDESSNGRVPGRILVVDDEADIRESLEALLSLEGYHRSEEYTSEFQS